MIPEMQEVLDCMPDEPYGLTQVCWKTGLHRVDARAILGLLEMEGYVTQLTPEVIWIKNRVKGVKEIWNNGVRG